MKAFRRSVAAAVGAVLFGAVAVVPAQSLTFNVCDSGCYFTSIQDAIFFSSDGDTIVVHDGTYKETINFVGKAITLRSMNGPAVTIIDATDANPDLEYWRVVTFDSGEGPETVLEGFTITGGKAAAYGGGIYTNGSPTIRDCFITLNQVGRDDNELEPGRGGGIFITSGASPEVSDCTISYNGAGCSGGGVYSAGSPVLTRCEILKNSSGNAGGGVFVSGSMIIEDCLISENAAAKTGGGVHAEGGLAISDSVISKNEAADDAEAGNGGGVFAFGGTLSIASSVVSGNTARTQATEHDLRHGYGGGLYVENVASPAIVNTTVSGNFAEWRGGGIASLDSVASILNCTVSGNRVYKGDSGLSDGGGIYFEGNTGRIVNTVVWYNEKNGVTWDQVGGDYLNLTVAYSNVMWGNPGVPGVPWPGTGNVDVEPRFVGPVLAAVAPTAEGDYRLDARSPCKDVGTGDSASYPGIPADDIGGDLRPAGQEYDIGSDEYVGVKNDWNADGRQDILWRNHDTGQNYVWYMFQSMPVAGDFLPGMVKTNWQIGGADDFSRNFKQDILWRNRVTGANYIWYMDGASYAGGEVVPRVGDTDWVIEGTADFDGDHSPDIFWRNTATGANYIWYMNGASPVGGDAVASTGVTWRAAGFDDFNGDGMPDIFWRNTASGQNYIWYMDGASVIGGEETFSAGSILVMETTGDFDYDGNPDIVMREYTAGNNFIGYMDGGQLPTGSTVPFQAQPDTNWHIEK